MNSHHFAHCPICRSSESNELGTIDCGNLDHSPLYPTVRLVQCSICGHVHNGLTEDELAGLHRYYDEEYAQANLSATDNTADRPGSESKLTRQRYDNLYGALAMSIDHGQKILDVGCALGGFLDYLYRKGFRHLFGVDTAQTYVEQARLSGRHSIEPGDAQQLPFEDGSFDIIVMEQVLEHLSDPFQAFMESKRVLRKGGILCIGVPDAARYNDYYFFDHYWLLLREHIQHFDITHLALLGKRTGFELLHFREASHAIMSEQMVMPTVYAVFRLTDHLAENPASGSGLFALKNNMERYLRDEGKRLQMKRRKIASVATSGNPVFAWGIGREFLYLYESGGLKDCRLAGLIDSNGFKQSFCTVGNMAIEDGATALSRSSDDSVLIITAVAHTEVIRNTSISLGYKGDFLVFD